MKFEDIILKVFCKSERMPLLCCSYDVCKYLSSKKIDTAATNGKDIYVNEDFLKSQNQRAKCASFIRSIARSFITCAKNWFKRQKVWNIAADIVVNDLIIRNTSFDLPSGAILIVDMKICPLKKYMKHYYLLRIKIY